MTPHPTEDLGLYALGFLEQAEREAIGRHLRSCATCRAELATHESTLAALAQESAVAPVPDMRGRIVASHRARPLGGRPAFAYAVALVLALALVVSLASLSQERALRADYAQALDAVAGGARVVSLEAKGDARARGAVVLAPGGVTYLVLDLPAPPPGKAYQAWVIRGGTPSPAGMAPARSGVVTMELHEVARPGDTAAVTLEDAGGARLPTTAPVLVGGV